MKFAVGQAFVPVHPKSEKRTDRNVCPTSDALELSPQALRSRSQLDKETYHGTQNFLE